MSAFRIPLLEPVLPANAIDLLRRCIEDNFVSSVGPMVGEFERLAAARLGARSAIACNSGTSALHLALLAAGVGQDDEVVLSDLTFIATANAARYCGARTLFVDSEMDTWNLDADLLQEELNRRVKAGHPVPRAIIAVHILGHPFNPDVLEVAENYGVTVIEDAAESLGASWINDAGRKLTGTAGALGCLSFNGNKLITCGAGGMVLTDDDALATRVRHLSTQARLPGVEYDHDEIGYNYRLSNVSAAVGLSQLYVIDEFLAAKSAIAASYDGAFRHRDGIALPPNAPWGARSGWLYSVLLDTYELRERVRSALADKGIEARPIWKPMHLQAPYNSERCLGGGRVATEIWSRGLSLPSSVSLSREMQEEVIDVVCRAAEL